MRNDRSEMLILVATFLASALAGCVGDAEGDEKQDTTEPPPQEGLGTLAVTVLSDLFEPIPGADVTIHDLKLNKTTDADGKATFTNLEPNRYTVFASKLGFLAGAKTLEVIADTETRLQFQLVTVPPPAEPYKLGYTWEGFISCSVGAKPLQTEDQCDNVTFNNQQYAELDGNAKSRFPFPIHKGASAAAVLLEEGTSGTNMGQTYVIHWIKPAGPTPNTFEGASPLQRHYRFNESQAFTGLESLGEINVRAASGGNPPSWDGAALVVWQKNFLLYLTMFYNGEPMPDDYDPKSEHE